MFRYFYYGIPRTVSLRDKRAHWLSKSQSAPSVTIADKLRTSTATGLGNKASFCWHQKQFISFFTNYVGFARSRTAIK